MHGVNHARTRWKQALAADMRESINFRKEI